MHGSTIRYSHSSWKAQLLIKGDIRYPVARLVDEIGADDKLIDMKVRLTADCPKVKAAQFYDQCGAGYPDLVLLFAR
jgi:hypothetical protein